MDVQKAGSILAPKDVSHQAESPTLPSDVRSIANNDSQVNGTKFSRRVGVGEDRYVEVDEESERLAREYANGNDAAGEKLYARHGLEQYYKAKQPNFSEEDIEDAEALAWKEILKSLRNGALNKVSFGQILFRQAELAGYKIFKEQNRHKATTLDAQLSEGCHKADSRTIVQHMPLMPEDLDLIPSIWRNPDRVVTDDEHPEGPVFEFDTPDGGVLRLPIIRIGNSITTGTLYKKKKTRGRAGVEDDGRPTS